jgi:hypothetical protein
LASEQVRTGEPKHDITLFFNVGHFLLAAFVVVSFDAMVNAHRTRTQ